MKLFIVWAIASLITYWHIMYSNIGKNVFQHNLRVEGTAQDVITFFCICFSIGFWLWWPLMFPICCLIGRKDK
jgi:hypothetical protein